MKEKLDVKCYFANVNELHKCTGSVLFSINGYPFKADYEMNMITGEVYSVSFSDIPTSWYDAIEPVKMYIKDAVRKKLKKTYKVFLDDLKDYPEVVQGIPRKKSLEEDLEEE